MGVWVFLGAGTSGSGVQPSGIQQLVKGVFGRFRCKSCIFEKEYSIVEVLFHSRSKALNPKSFIPYYPPSPTS